MKEICTALLEARKEMGKLVKDASNPHFKSKYATLEAVHNVAIPALTAAGIIAIEYSSVSLDGKPQQHLDLLHTKTGEEIKSCLPLVAKDPSNPQHLGSAQTYARRYLMQAAAGLTPEDDDGNAASSNRFSDAKEEKQKVFDRMIAKLEEMGIKNFYDPKRESKTQKCINDKGWSVEAFTAYCKKGFEEAGKMSNDYTEVKK